MPLGSFSFLRSLSNKSFLLNLGTEINLFDAIVLGFSSFLVPPIITLAAGGPRR